MDPSEETPISELATVVQRLQTQEPLAGEKYYFLSLTGDENGKTWCSTISQYLRHAMPSPQLEVRQAGFVFPDVMRAHLNAIGQPGLMINSESDVVYFLILGGHGIIRQCIADASFPQMIAEEPVAPLGSKLGYVAADSVPESKFVKRPRKWMTQNVRQRDHEKCQLCGRGEHDGFELTLHHITMRKWGGFTEKDNLITLCRGCHDKVDEMGNDELYRKIGIDRYASGSGDIGFEVGVELYRRIMAREWSKPTEVEVDDL